MAEYKPDDLAYWDNKCSDASVVYAEYVHQEKIFQVASAAYFAALVMEFKSKFPDESNVALEMRSKASEDWKKFSNEQMDLLKKAGRAWIQYEDCKRRCEVSQSLLAFHREEFKRIG